METAQGGRKQPQFVLTGAALAVWTCKEVTFFGKCVPIHLNTPSYHSAKFWGSFWSYNTQGEKESLFFGNQRTHSENLPAISNFFFRQVHRRWSLVFGISSIFICKLGLLLFIHCLIFFVVVVLDTCKLSLILYLRLCQAPRWSINLFLLLKNKASKHVSI